MFTLCTNNKHAEKKNQGNNSISQQPEKKQKRKEKKSPRVTLTKERKDFYNEKFKSLMKETEEITRRQTSFAHGLIELIV